MTLPALQQGDFVWCAFPERETPLRPGPLHVAYTLAVAAVGSGYGVMTAYTTSQTWAGALPHGVIAFDSAEAAGLGQTRAFVLDLRRLAYLPITVAWFPRAGEEGAGGSRPRAEGIAGPGECDGDGVGEAAAGDLEPERTALGTCGLT